MNFESTLSFQIAYWKKRWVYVPLFHCPESNLTTADTQSKEVSLDENSSESENEIKVFEKIAGLARETIVPWLWAEKELKQLCKRNDISIAWVTDRFPRNKHHLKEGINRRETRKVQSLDPKKFKLICKELIKLDKRATIIAKIIWYFNNILNKGGDFITLQEILRLQRFDISIDKWTGLNSICFRRIGVRGSHLIAHYLPIQLWKSLCKQINENSIFVFSNRDGGPLLPGQIDTVLKRAAKMAGFKESITSLSLRPKFDKLKVQRVINSDLGQLTQEEWHKICCYLPSLLPKKGRKPSYERIDIMNAIFYHLDKRCPFRKLPSHFPPYAVVWPQYQRWKRSGVFNAAVNFLKNMKAPNSITK